MLGNCMQYLGSKLPGPQLSLQMKSENCLIPSLPCFPLCQIIHFFFVSKAIRNIFQSSNTDPSWKEAMPVSWIPDLTSANRRWFSTLYFKEIIISLPMIYFTQRDLPGIVKWSLPEPTFKSHNALLVLTQGHFICSFSEERSHCFPFKLKSSVQITKQCWG